MTESAPTQQQDKKAKLKATPVKVSLLQRKCACGKHSGAEQEDASLQRMPMLQRKCACGQHTIGGGMCAACSQKQEESDGQAVDASEIGGRMGANTVARSAINSRFQPNFVDLRARSSNRIQAKLTVNAPGDIYEQEADRVADQVVRQHERTQTPSANGRSIHLKPVSVQQMVQREESSFPEEAEEQLAQRKGEGTPAVAPNLEGRLNTLAGSGHKLPGDVQMKMEESFGASFDRVRVHTDGEAAQISRSLNAEAFTYGNDIYFGANRYEPGSSRGKRLLAHELTHTLQQNGIQRKMIQRRGGATVGQMGIHTNVVSGGLTAGHAWLSYTPTGGSTTTYGTWGNKTPIGLHTNLELGYHPGVASRRTDLDSTDESNFSSFRTANNSWSLINNCASFAARGWKNVTGESLSYTTIGIPNPSALGAGIVAAGAILTPTAGGSSSSGGGSSNTSSGTSSSAGSSGDSSSSSSW